MRTGFERDIGRRAPRLFAGFRECLRLRMRTPALRGNATTDNAAVLHDQASTEGLEPVRPTCVRDSAIASRMKASSIAVIDTT